VVHIKIFGLFGLGLGKLLKLSLKGPETVLVGFFGYYGIMQLVFLPSMLLRVNFSLFVIIWAIVLSTSLLLIVIYCNRQICHNIKEIFCDFNTKPKYLMILLAFTVAMLVIYQGLFNVHGYDASFYIGTIATTLYTNTMFVVHGETGWAEPVIDMRYALSGVFYMNTAFWCRILDIPPLMAQKYTFGSLAIILHSLFIYMIGLKIFESDTSKKLAYWFTILAVSLNVFFITTYSSSGFLLRRSFEAKSYCANVVFIGVFYLFLCLWKSGGLNKYWKMLFIVAFASVPVTMSSIVILPAMIFIFTVAESITKKDKMILLKGGVSLLPNAVYLGAFYLFLRGVWLINL
jgi:hypothetical protein